MKYEPIIQRHQLKVKHLAKRIGCSEGALWWHIKKERKDGQMNAEFAKKLRQALVDMALDVMEHLM